MKKLFLFLLPFILMACDSFAELNLSEKDAGKPILAAVGDEISIGLNGNATTGYKWQFSCIPSSAYKILEETYEENTHPRGMVGVGGRTFYKIKLLQPGDLVIEARYFRPWEEFNPKTDKLLKFIIETK